MTIIQAIAILVGMLLVATVLLGIIAAWFEYVVSPLFDWIKR